MREFDNVAKEAFVPLVLVDSANVFHIDLNEIRGEIYDSGKVRVMAAEIVYGDFATERFQAFCRNDCHFPSFRIDTFEYFENNPGRIDAVFLKGFPDQKEEIRISQIIRGKIDSENYVFVREFGECFFRHDAGYRAQTSVFLCGGKE